MKTDAEKVVAHVDRTDSSGCWVWTGSRFGNGYGMVRSGGRSRVAHRWLYELLVAPIPDALVLDHLCRNRACVNPAHLEPVTTSVNTLRGASSVDFTGTCRSGRHEIDPSARLTHRRRCAECTRESDVRNHRETAGLISAAHHALGLTFRAYVAEYGRSRETARKVIEAHTRTVTP